MENIEQPQQMQQPQYVEQQVSQTKNPYKLIVIFLSVIIVILLVGVVFLFRKVMMVDKNTSSQQQVLDTTQNNSDKTNNLITVIPSVTTAQNKSFTLADYGGVSNISFTYPSEWILKQANQEQRNGWGAQLTSPSNKLSIWMGNAASYLGVAGMGCEKSLSVNDRAKIVYYDVSSIPSINGYKLFTVVSDNGQGRIYDSFVGSNQIDNYAIERNKDLRCVVNGGGIKGKQAIGYGDDTTLNLYIKIIVNELGGQSAESEQITTQTTDYIKSIIESDEYQQAKKIITSAKMN